MKKEDASVLEKVDQAMAIYNSLKSSIDRLSIGDIRQQGTVFESMAKNVLAGLLAKIGYPVYGSRKSMSAKLGSSIVRLKLNSELTARIG